MNLSSILFTVIGIVFLFLSALMSGLWPQIAAFSLYNFWDAVLAVFFLLSGIVFLGTGIMDDPRRPTGAYVIDWLMVYVVEMWVVAVSFVSVGVAFLIAWLFSVALYPAIVLSVILIVVFLYLLSR